MILTGLGIVVALASLLFLPVGFFGVVIWIALAFVAGQISRSKGHSFIWTVGLSMWLSPLFGLIYAAVSTADPEELDRRLLMSGRGKMCPQCAEVVKAAAIRCRFCGADL